MSQPVYCRECRKNDTWERFSEKDVITESGKVFLAAWRCKGCGSLAYWQPGEQGELI